MSQDASLFILFVFLSLLLALASREANKKLKIPVPSLLLSLGLLLRIICPHVGLSSLSLQIDNTNTSTVLLSLIPPLVFQGAFTTDWHFFKKELGQIVPMATSVVFLSSLLQSIVIKYILQYPFTWNESVLLGVLLCATDHATTRDIMKSMHMEASFNTLVSGETIINQVTVITLFMTLNDSPDAISDIGMSILSFIKRIGLGCLLGLVFSYVMGKAIRRIVNDYMQETNLTLVTTFLLFWVAEVSLKCSGVMAMVTFGLYMAAYGKTLISPTVEKRLMNVWDILSHNSENIAFILGGMHLGHEFVDLHNLVWSDLYKLIVAYISQLLIRFIVILTHYPLLRRFGYGVSFAKIIVLTLGGIKGVISTLLAVIATSGNTYDAKFKGLILFLVIGVTFLTICINPILLKLAEVKFKFINLTDIQENILLRVTSQIMQRSYRKLEKLEKSKEFPLVKWNEVMDIAGPRELVVAIMKRSTVGKKILKEHPDASSEMLISRFCDYCIINDIVLACEMRKRFYNSLKGIYWDEFESGQCLGQTSLVLINSTSVLQHKDSEPIQDWKHIENEIFNEKLIKFFHNFFEKPMINGIFRRLTYNRIIKVYDTASTFLKAHKIARGLFENMEIDQFVLQQILEESEEQENLCKIFLKDHIIDDYPEIISEVQSKMASYALLISQRKLINKIFQQGVIKNLEYNYLLTAIDTNFKALTFLTSPKIPPLKDILRSRFKKASKTEINELLQQVDEMHLKPGSTLFKENEESTGAYLILTGKVREISNWIDQELSIGNIVGVQHLLPGIEAFNTTSATTLTVVTTVHLPKNMLEYECFEEDIYKEAAEEFLILNKEKFNIKNANNEHIIFIVSKSYIKKAYQGSLISLRRGGFVIKGKIRSDKGCFSLLRPTRKKIESIDDALLLIFPANFSKILRNNRNLSDALAEFYIKNATKKQEYKQFYAFKDPQKVREVKDKKKIKKQWKSNMSIDSLDKLLEF